MIYLYVILHVIVILTFISYLKSRTIKFQITEPADNNSVFKS